MINLSNLCNFQLFASNIDGNVSHRELRNCWLAKRMSYTFFVKKHAVHQALIFRDN